MALAEAGRYANGKAMEIAKVQGSMSALVDAARRILPVVANRPAVVLIQHAVTIQVAAASLHADVAQHAVVDRAVVLETASRVGVFFANTIHSAV